jgi:ATP-dependent DNA helicase RecQ
LTATATERVRRDIEAILTLRAENEFVASFDRPNLYLSAQPRGSGLTQTLAFLDAHRDQSGIIYCSTRSRVDSLTRNLSAKGWPVVGYHAGMDDATRLRNQELFARDRVPIIVATIAFGMGIDKSNVRFVLHYNMPPCIENYYQEIGRAGRDGLRSDCLLLYSQADIHTIKWFIEEGAEKERPGRTARLQAMVRYAEAPGCRRAMLLEYFDEEPPIHECRFCDNCLSSAATDAEQVDVSEAARLFLDCVRLTGQVFGSRHIVDVLRGSQAAKITKHHHDRLPVHGAGKNSSSDQWRRYADQFIRQGLLMQDMEHGSLRLTERGRTVLDGNRVLIPVERSHPVQDAHHTDYDQVLFERLRSLRRQIADGKNLPPYVIFSDRSLVEMAYFFPQSAPSFLAIHGVGQRKLAEYGDRFLAEIGAYCAEHNLGERVRAEKAPDPDRPAGPALQAAGVGANGRSAEVGDRFAAGSSVAEVGDRFAAGSSVADLESLFGLRQSTIFNHLYQCVRAGRKFPPERIVETSRVSEDDRQRVLTTMARLGPERLRPIYDALNEEISFDELHVLRLYYLCSR